MAAVTDMTGRADDDVPDGLPWPAQWRRTSRRARRYADQGSDGVQAVDVEVAGLREPAVLLPFRPTPRWHGAVFVLLGAFFVVAAIALLVMSVTEQRWTGLIGFLLLGALGVLFSLGAFAALAARRDTVPGLHLTPTRVVFDGGLDRLALPWDEIVELRAFTIVFGLRTLLPRPWQNWMGLVGRSSARPVVAIPDHKLAMDPLLAYHAIRHYRENPAHRSELAGAEAVGRIVQRRLT